MHFNFIRINVYYNYYGICKCLYSFHIGRICLDIISHCANSDYKVNKNIPSRINYMYYIVHVPRCDKIAHSFVKSFH